MLYNRGYKRPEEAPNAPVPGSPTGSEFYIVTETRPDYTLRPFSKIIVFFTDDDKIGVKLIRSYYDQMIEMGISKGIIIVKDNITSFAKNEISSFVNKEIPVYIEIFLENTLMFDITEHELVPKHELISVHEKETLFNKYNIKESNLLKILSTDPVSRYYDFQKMDVIKITRPSETGGFYTNYRIVV